MATAKKLPPSKPKKVPAPKPGKKYENLHELVNARVGEYENQAEAARQMGIGKTYLSRIQTGEKSNPSEEILSRLGITRHVHYTAA